MHTICRFKAAAVQTPAYESAFSYHLGLQLDWYEWRDDMGRVVGMRQMQLCRGKQCRFLSAPWRSGGDGGNGKTNQHQLSKAKLSSGACNVSQKTGQRKSQFAINAARFFNSRLTWPLSLSSFCCPSYSGSTRGRKSGLQKRLIWIRALDEVHQRLAFARPPIHG